VLTVGPLRRDHLEPLVISFGNDIYSYTRAHRTKLYLSTPTLPELVRAYDAPLPKNFRLAFACFILPMALSLCWLLFVRRFDRAQPEPLWLVLATFAIGGASAFGAGLVEGLLGTLTPYLSPEIMTLGGQLQAFPVALIVFTFVVGVSEEGAKFLGAWSLAYHRREFDEPVDGIIYGAASSLGFAAVENVKYFTDGRLSTSLVAARTFTSVPAHLFFGAIWGYALGRKLVSKRTSLLGFFLLAALAHGAFDTFLSIDGLGSLAMVLNFGLSIVFVQLLRKSLRYGAITADTAPVSKSTRSLFSVGTPAAFAGYAIAVHLIAFVLLALGAYVEHTHQRIGYGFLGVASFAIFALGFSAYGLTVAMPLDVVVDALGVTFAGATRRWERIHGFDRRAFIGTTGVRAEIHLRSADGDIRLGPGDPTTMDRLAHVLASELRRRQQAAEHARGAELPIG
jgi:RsiW-degrading membrane proteinase PrsW (M82 family)